MKIYLSFALLGLLAMSAVAQDVNDASHQNHMDHSAKNPNHFYDADCCHERDCAPVTKFQSLPDGREYAESRHGNVYITADFPVTKRRESKDHQVHICQRKASPWEIEQMPHKTTTGQIAICVYYPGGS
jgi:hypothetical protein